MTHLLRAAQHESGHAVGALHFSLPLLKVVVRADGGGKTEYARKFTVAEIESLGGGDALRAAGRNAALRRRAGRRGRGGRREGARRPRFELEHQPHRRIPRAGAGAGGARAAGHPGGRRRTDAPPMPCRAIWSPPWCRTSAASPCGSRETVSRVTVGQPEKPRPLGAELEG